MNLLFCADMHGNEMHYFKLFQKAKDYDVLILGGDLCPKNLDMQRQREFLEQYLIPRLKELKDSVPSLNIYIMFGNDDFAGNLDVLTRHDGDLYHVLIERTLELGQGFFITGYPFVPITPFRLKDWEKWDLGEQKKRKIFELEKPILLEGLSTWENRYEVKKFDVSDEESIEKDMLNMFGSPEKTIYVFHTPPYNTNLDMVYSNEHVGSLAVRMAIEGYQPFLTLHGHIHETVEVSGSFVDRIQDTICAGVGNHNTLNSPAVLEIQLPARSVKRLKLD